MKANIVKRVIFVTIILLMLIVCTKSFAFYTEEILGTVEYTEEYQEWDNMTEEEKQNSVMPRKYDIRNNAITNSRNTAFKSSFVYYNLMAPSNKYDLRQNSNITVRDQGKTGQCWAITINSVLESNIEKTTKKASPLFSSRYVEYATSKTFLDGINPIGYNREVGTGGFPEIALGLYTSGNGPVLEQDFRFQDNESKIMLSEIQNPNIKVQKQVKDYVRFPGIYKSYNGKTVTYKDGAGKILTTNEITQIRNMIKNHIMQYGAVASQTYGIGGVSGDAKKYYNNPSQFMKSTAYFCNNSRVSADHQITIIGWDDNYEVTNFNENYRPSTPGAYIVLNSWGRNFGENGVFYISYEDVCIEKDVLGIVLAEDIDFDNIYQHDELGNNYVMTASKSIYGANVFERAVSGKTEFLTQISVSSLVDTTCDIYVNPNNGELNLENFKKIFSNVEIKDGYHTFKLKEPLELKGDKFSVILKYNTDENSIAYIALEHPDNYWATATSEKGQSYISVDGNKWDDMFDLGNSRTIAVPSKSNLCIKAFTEYEEEKYFQINNYKSDGNYICGISPKTKLKELTNNISTNMEYYVYKGDTTIVDSEQIISTGMKISNGEKTYTIVVTGDIDGNGKLSIGDVIKANLYVANIITLTNEFEKAADVTGDGKVRLGDLIKMNLSIVNL